MSGEVFYSEIGDWREGPIMIVTNEGVVEGVLSVVERSEVGTQLSQTLVEGVLFAGRRYGDGLGGRQPRPSWWG